MSTQSEQILRSALSLPESERAEIAAALIHSLDPHVDEAVDEAWAAEIERRIATIDRGEVALIPFQDVLAEMRRRGHG
jgi:putative addiction module component (TIGR02574 family)